MEINFKGLVDLHILPTSEPLLPLFEAIVNSMQSIIQGKVENGKINIILERDIKEEPNSYFIDGLETDIENIIIKDNGIGFTEENYKSFNTYATDFKKMMGCKGVGRMIWLKAFNSVEVDSVYTENNIFFHRKFIFDSKNAISSEINETINATKEIENCTSIKLQGLKTKNKNNTPKKLQTIARDVLNHCFIYFVLGIAPKITVSDENDTISINNLFEKIGKENINNESFKIGNYDFNLIHYKNFNSNNPNHILNLCANNRRVTSINLQNILNGVSGRLITREGKEFSYTGYITSMYLDENVNKERTSFNIEEKHGTFFANISKNDIIEEAAKLLLDYLSDDIHCYNEIKKNKIEEYVHKKNPKYRFLLSEYPQCMESIVFCDEENKLEMELFKQEQQYKYKLKEEGANLQKEIKENKDYKSVIKKVTEYADKLSEMGNILFIEKLCWICWKII